MVDHLPPSFFGLISASLVSAGMRVDCREGVNNTAEWIPPRDMIAGEASYSISIESSQSSAVLASVSIVDVDGEILFSSDARSTGDAECGSCLLL